MSKRKLDDLVDIFENMSFSHERMQCTALVVQSSPKRIRVFNTYKQKNIFGLEPIPEQETFTYEEVQILLDKREKLLYKKYLELTMYENIKEKIVPKVTELT